MTISARMPNMQILVSVGMSAQCDHDKALYKFTYMYTAFTYSQKSHKVAIFRLFGEKPLQ